MRVSICAFLSLFSLFLFVCDSVSLGAWTVAINELMASNANVVADEQEDYDDWIELHNYGDDAVDVAGCFLSDDPADRTKWRIPATGGGCDHDPGSRLPPPLGRWRNRRRTSPREFQAQRIG